MQPPRLRQDRLELQRSSAASSLRSSGAPRQEGSSTLSLLSISSRVDCSRNARSSG
ncbi:MAG: hypothetical protein ACK52U_16910 [Synechococcaceae cyanobacterium]